MWSLLTTVIFRADVQLCMVATDYIWVYLDTIFKTRMLLLIFQFNSSTAAETYSKKIIFSK